MNFIISWLFGWFVGLSAPVLIAAGSAYVIWKAPASWSWLRQPAFIALTVSGCWLGMTFITQSAVSEAIRHEREAVAAAVKEQSVKIEEIQQRLNIALAEIDIANREAESRLPSEQASAAAKPDAACRKTTKDDIHEIEAP